MIQTVTLIRGDGITRELIDPVIGILKAAGAKVQFDEQLAGTVALEQKGVLLPQATIDSIRKNGVVLKGKLIPPKGSGYSSPNSELRKELDLFATVRPLRNIPGLKARHQNVDIVIIRESTEGLYAGLEHAVSEDSVASLRVVTKAACERISRYAFQYAREHGRKKVTLVHKANIMKMTDGLFISVAERVHREEFAEITFNKLIIDNACMQLVMRPHQYDVILGGNLYGDIMSDLGAGIIGGISATLGMCCNEETHLFEALHGDAPELEGLGVANPLPMLLPACAMLTFIGQHEASTRIKEAIKKTFSEGPSVLTPDLGGTGGTQKMVDSILSFL